MRQRYYRHVPEIITIFGGNAERHGVAHPRLHLEGLVLYIAKAVAFQEIEGILLGFLAVGAAGEPVANLFGSFAQGLVRPAILFYFGVNPGKCFFPPTIVATETYRHQKKTSGYDR